MHMTPIKDHAKYYNIIVFKEASWVLGNALWGQIQGIQREQLIRDPLFFFSFCPPAGRTLALSF